MLGHPPFEMVGVLRGPYVHYSGSGLVLKGEGKSGNILGLLTGTVQVFDLPANAAQLRALSGHCLKNRPYHDALLEEAVPQQKDRLSRP